MKYPALYELNTSREMIDVFKGYNHNLRIGDGEFYDMTNLTSDDYPILSPRQQRGVYASPNEPLGMISKDNLCYVDGSDFIINGYRIDMKLSNEPKTLVSMGSYVIIMPDKMWINTQPKKKDEYLFGKIEAEVEATSGSVQYTICNVEGNDYDLSPTNMSDTAPPNPENMQYWIDTSSVPHTLKQYSSNTSQWISIATTYIKVSFSSVDVPDLTTIFSDGDGVTIEGITVDELSDLNSSIVMQKVGANYFIVIGMTDITATQDLTEAAPITITRKMPEMDFIIESENRLWGCHYGVALNGEVVNEIYASKLGDFKNWNCFAGISTDSYVASVGTDGQFTGAVTHLGHPIFFKENHIHKIYGNYPANFQIQTTACRGVQRGCSKSLATVNEVLYYKARSGVCAYDGSLPTDISFALGGVTYGNAVAGYLGNKYYISMQDSEGAYHLFVYDTLKGMWHREDDTQAVEFCNSRGELYYIDYADNQIKTVHGSGTLDTSLVKWEAVTGIIGTDSPDKKYISRLDVRLKLDVGAKVVIYAEYDSNGVWEHLLTMDGTSLRSFAVPVRARRCDHMRLKISGYGGVKIFSICKTIEQGSDV